MTDLNVVMGDLFTDTPSSEKHNSNEHISIPQSSMLYNIGGSTTGIHSGNNSPSRVRRQSSHSSFLRSGSDRRFLRYENTYQTEPREKEHLDVVRIRRIAKSVLETATAGYKYQASHAKLFTVALAERMRGQMKQLAFSRYKLVTHVCVGQKKGQDLRVASRCLWNYKCDRQITMTKETPDAYVTVTLFYVYTD